MPFDPDVDAPEGGVKLQLSGGYIVVGPNSDGCCEVHELYVNLDSRRKGIGTALMSFAKAWAKTQGLYPVILNCSPGNESGRKFYESLGMRQVSVVYQMEVS